MANKPSDNNPQLSGQDTAGAQALPDFKPGQMVRCGGLIGTLSWVDPAPKTILIDKLLDGKKTGEKVEQIIPGQKTGDCNLVYMVQVGKGTPASNGFDGLYFQIKSLKTNVSQLTLI